MRGKDLYEKITGIDDDIISDTVNAGKSRKPIYLRWVAAAACFAIIISVVSFLTETKVITAPFTYASINTDLAKVWVMRDIWLMI